MRVGYEPLSLATTAAGDVELVEVRNGASFVPLAPRPEHYRRLGSTSAGPLAVQDSG
ncbi:MAG: hypothetical protein QOI16_1215, partial [Pseudonocardiales bacterium]|nr:hypothetical protein [Pseudonocardiales bacterium]